MWVHIATELIWGGGWRSIILKLKISPPVIPYWSFWTVVLGGIIMTLLVNVSL